MMGIQVFNSSEAMRMGMASIVLDGFSSVKEAVAWIEFHGCEIEHTAYDTKIWHVPQTIFYMYHNRPNILIPQGAILSITDLKKLPRYTSLNEQSCKKSRPSQ